MFTTYLTHGRAAELSPTVDRNEPTTWLVVLSETGHRDLAERIRTGTATTIELSSARWATASSLMEWW